MTKKEIEQHIGQFGKIEYNGRYLANMHGYIKEIIDGNVIIKRLEGNNLTIPIKSIKKFKPMPEPK